MRGGFWSFLFLIPLGFAAGVFGPASAWLSWAAASVLNICVTSVIFRGAGFLPRILNNLYFIAMSAGFTWIMAGKTVRTAYRFIIASAAGTLVFLFILYSDGGSAFREIILHQAETLSSAYISASGPDVVRRSLLEQTLRPENLLSVITQAILRGGALVSCLSLFVFSRQTALAFAWLLNRREQASGLSGFHAPPGAIWALSLSLGAVLIFRRAGLAFPEIAAWNFLVICGIIFLAQGAGIALHTLKRRPPAARFFGNILIVILIISPGINVLSVGILILLGIAENWLPLRAADRPASTPEP
jgi:hypothetical protein